MAAIKYTTTKLDGTGKEGILRPDSDGYYEITIGALNIFNSVGEYYTLEGAKELFESSSKLMRRIKNGNLKSELGHPKKLPGMSMNDFINRLHTVEETNICCHIKEVWLDDKFGLSNPKVSDDTVGIIAKVKPAGPKGAYLKESLDNKHENVCFSVRGFTVDYYKAGKIYKVLKEIITWDVVSEPGLSIANKFDSKSLESMTLESIDDLMITETQLEDFLKEPDGMATEDSKESVAILLNRMKTTNKDKRLYTKW